MESSIKTEFFKKTTGFLTLLAVLAICILAALRGGSASMTSAEFMNGLLKKEGFETQSQIIYLLRLPRVFGAVLSGIGLSVSGVLLQSVTGNELAAPNIIGVNSGAGFAVVLLLFFFPSAALLSPFVAFFGAFAATLLIISIASKINSTGSTVILSGIAVTAILNAAISFISLIDSDILSTYNYFSIGGLSGVTMEEIVLPAFIIAVCAAAAFLLSKKIDALTLGDSIASSLGIRVPLLRAVCLILASACAASVVSFAGLLGFVGLIIPHISRRLCGSSNTYLLPVSALSGAVLVVLADLFGRTLLAPTEIPVGIIMAFIGAPFFFWLLIRRKRNDRFQ